MLLLVAIIAAIAVARGADAAKRPVIDPAALPIKPIVVDTPPAQSPEGDAAHAAE
jgi:hypothetical protein